MIKLWQIIYPTPPKYCILIFKDEISGLKFFFACLKLGSLALSDMKSFRQKKVLTLLVMA